MVTILFPCFLAEHGKIRILYSSLALPIHSSTILPSNHLSTDPPNFLLVYFMSSYSLTIQAVFLNNLKFHTPYPDFSVDFFICFLQKNVPNFPKIHITENFMVLYNQCSWFPSFRNMFNLYQKKEFLELP